MFWRQLFFWCVVQWLWHGSVTRYQRMGLVLLTFDLFGSSLFVAYVILQSYWELLACVLLYSKFLTTVTSCNLSLVGFYRKRLKLCWTLNQNHQDKNELHWFSYKNLSNTVSLIFLGFSLIFLSAGCHMYLQFPVFLL